jgi:hypothetical protein
MPAPLYIQTVIAVLWDFDRTLIPSNMQGPLFAEYGVDEEAFWREVDGLVEYHAAHGERIARDLAYLLHIMAYVEAGVFSDLSNAKLKELGAHLEPCPGIPEFFDLSRKHVGAIPDFAREGITVEHYVVSTGLEAMIDGSVIAPHVDGIWANTFVEGVPGPGYQEKLPVRDGGLISHLSSVVDNTSKTRPLFEINKGVNANPDLDVNSRMAESQRRVPLQHMIYVADGPSDVPVFSILNKAGGKTLGVYNLEPRNNHRQVKQLQEQGRIQGMAKADYRPGEAAFLWLIDSIEQIGYEIVESRRQAFSEIENPPGHV